MAARGLNFCVRDGNRCFPSAIHTASLAEAKTKSFTIPNSYLRDSLLSEKTKQKTQSANYNEMLCKDTKNSLVKSEKCVKKASRSISTG